MNRIRSVEVFPVGVRVKSTFTFASGSAGGAGDEAILIYVRIADDDGAVGWGECRPMRQWSYETPESAVSTIRRYLAPAIIGHDAADLLAALIDCILVAFAVEQDSVLFRDGDGAGGAKHVWRCLLELDIELVGEDCAVREDREIAYSSWP